MNTNSGNDKLDWMYKGANSLVDREEYLLGRSVDKTLEQLNAEEKEKKLGIVAPKNHVEHECIPPSIRDFNKIVQAEQVDISAKLQEDPLVAIKKREEEARRQFLQNPVQLKKLQEALKAQEQKKKKSNHKKSRRESDSDLDSKIVKKLKYLKNPSGLVGSTKNRKKDTDDAIDTILMHKFNELKDRLSQDDLNDILAGKVSDSDDSNEDRVKKRRKQKSSSSDDSEYTHNNKKLHKKEKSSKRRRRRSTSSSDSDSESDEKSYQQSKSHKNEDVKRKDKLKRKDHKEWNKDKRKRRQSSCNEETSEEYNRKRTREKSNKNLYKGNSKTDSIQKRSEGPKTQHNLKLSTDEDLENKILAKLRMLRNSPPSNKATKQSNIESESDENKRSLSVSSDSQVSDPKKGYGSDSDENVSKPRTFGLVKADGTKIALNSKREEIKKVRKTSKTETMSKPEKKTVKRLTEDEKEKLRREMMRNAEKRDKERSDNLKKYREENSRESKDASNFDREFMHKQLLRTTKEATVESRIRSNLNNIQRSSRHMESHFSRR